MKLKQEAILAQFTARFAPEVVDKWSKVIDDWDVDPEKPNPYEEVGTGRVSLSSLSTRIDCDND